jgi:hypothetical protein
LTTAEQIRALDVAHYRQGAAERRGFKPYGHGSVRSHLYGYAAEIAVARLLGVPMPVDWTWDADRRRGGDLVLADGTKIHVRSSRKGDRFMWRDGKDSMTGIWIYVDTSRYPILDIVGWLTGSQAYMVGGSGYVSRTVLSTMNTMNTMNCTLVALKWTLILTDRHITAW